MSIGFPSAISKPSGLTALPSGAKRPAFGTLYGFDASDGGGASVFNISTRETEATISASSPTNPTGEVTIAYGTDTEDLYIWDGVSWYRYNND